MKKTLSTRHFLVAAALLAPLSSSAPVWAQLPDAAQSGAPAVTVLIDGKPINFAGTPPQKVNGSLLVPLRAIFEALGAQVEFSNGIVRARRGTTQLQLQIGSAQALVNGQNRTLDVPAQVVFGSTLVPLRFVGEALGAGVNFNGATQTVTITSPANTKPGGGTDYTVPGTGQSVTGTLLSVESAPPTSVSVLVENQVKRYQIAPGALILRQISLATSATATPARQSARPINLGALASGETLRLSLDNLGRATQILVQATVIVARVQYAGGDQIVLDDERDTTLTIGPNLTYLDPQGRSATTATLAAGQSVALFISPQGRTIYRVSAVPTDYSLAGGPTTPDVLPGTGLPPTGAPQIQIVTHNATAPIKAGARLEISARATANQRLSASLGTKIQVPLVENTAQPGNYRATYVVRAGDDVLDARITARISGTNGFEATAQSQEPVTIDTIAPRLVGTFPTNGAQIAVAQPNIVIFADDLGGSGLGSAQIDLLTGNAANPARQTIPATVAPPTSINAVPPTPLSGLVRVNAAISDRAGNVLPVNFSFTVATGTPNGGANAIRSFTQSATRGVQIGENITLRMVATANGTATFQVTNRAGTVIARDLPMVENANRPGQYSATYRVPEGVLGPIRFQGRFDAGDGTIVNSEPTVPVRIAVQNVKLSVSAPKDGDAVDSPLIISGRASAGATIDLSLSATGTQFLVLPFNQDLGTYQARADDRGVWQTEAIEIPAIRNVQGLKITVSATQTDTANRQSEPVTISVSPQ